MFVYDGFQRPDGLLGGAWGKSNLTVLGYPASAQSAQITSGTFSPSKTYPSGGALIPYTGQTFGNNQWASAQISAIAPFTSVVHITACSSSAGTSTYTYTLTSGSALVVNQEVIVSGMTNAGNNKAVQITALGAGTFSGLVASPGADESGSNGTGNSPADCWCGVAVRCSADGKNGYFLLIGPNSGVFANNGAAPTDSRVYCRELWKLVNGTATFLTGVGVLTTVPDTAGDIYTLAVIGTALKVYNNGALISAMNATDSSIASGSPGISAGSLKGAGEWATPTTYTQGAGNTALQWTNFMAGDGTFGDGNGSTQLFQDTFTRANENPLSDGGVWSQDGHPDPLQLSSNLVQATVIAGSPTNGAYYTGALPANQYMQFKLHTWSDPAVSFYIFTRSTDTSHEYDLGFTSQNTASLYRINGSATLLLTRAYSFVSDTVITFACFSFPGTFNGTRLVILNGGNYYMDYYDSDTNITSGKVSIAIGPSAVAANRGQFSGPFNAGSFNGILNNSLAGNPGSLGLLGVGNL